MNRQTTAEAVNASLEINAAQGHKLIYDANDLASDRDLRVGVTVTIPKRAATTTTESSTPEIRAGC